MEQSKVNEENKMLKNPKSTWKNTEIQWSKGNWVKLDSKIETIFPTWRANGMQCRRNTEIHRSKCDHQTKVSCGFCLQMVQTSKKKTEESFEPVEKTSSAALAAITKKKRKIVFFFVLSLRERNEPSTIAIFSIDWSPIDHQSIRSVESVSTKVFHRLLVHFRHENHQTFSFWISSLDSSAVRCLQAAAARP